MNRAILILATIWAASVIALCADQASAQTTGVPSIDGAQRVAPQVFRGQTDYCPGGVAVIFGVEHNLPTTLGFTWPKTCTIWFTPLGLLQNALNKCMTTLHEIGHARYGLNHAPTGIMRPSQPMWYHPACITLKKQGWR